MLEPQGPLVTCPINNILPVEILEMIFEEHVKVEWRAPAIDGRVCRLWRQIVLNTPRAWSHLEIYSCNPPSVGELRLWLHRSGTAPLYIRVDQDFALTGDSKKWTSYNILSAYHARIASLRMLVGKLSFFEKRGFPCMRTLDVKRWSLTDSYSLPVQWGSLIELQTLRMGDTTVPLSWGVPLIMDVLWCTSLLRQSPSLTTLMLDCVSFDGVVPVAFPSLTYLSLFNVTGLKPYINAPFLATYHEDGHISGQAESFSAPLLSLVEYGVYFLQSGTSAPTEWHLSFPNVIRVSIRAAPLVLESFLAALSRQPQLLPALQAISVGWRNKVFKKKDQTSMEILVRSRSKACHVGVALYFETGPPFHIPLFFGHVSHCSIRRVVVSDKDTRTQNVRCEGLLGT